MWCTTSAPNHLQLLSGNNNWEKGKKEKGKKEKKTGNRKWEISLFEKIKKGGSFEPPFSAFGKSDCYLCGAAGMSLKKTGHTDGFGTLTPLLLPLYFPVVASTSDPK